MSDEERAFLNALVIRNKPVKLLEVGVAAGGSAIVMLNAIKDDPDAALYSIDYTEYWLGNNKTRCGYFVDEYPDLKPKFNLYTGGLALRFLDDIGGGIDFCFIDTVHSNPGEILDFLFVLPYLKDDALVVFHDTKLQTYISLPLNKYEITNNLLTSAIFGKTLIQGNFTRGDNEVEYPSKHGVTYFPNITAIKICKETKDRLYSIFNLLTVKWEYCPSLDEEKEIIDFFSRFYNKYYIDYMHDVFFYERKFFAYKLSFSDKLLRPVVKVISRIFSAGTRRTIRRILGERLSTRLYNIMRSG
jgi:hypothetical protein